MKKVFVIFGIIAVSLILCLCAFCACDEVVGLVAEAEDIPLSRSVVRSNVLPFYNFSSCVLVSSAPSSADVPIASTLPFSYSDGVLSVSLTDTTGYLYITFVKPQLYNNLGTMSILCNKTGSAVYQQIWVTNLDNNVTNYPTLTIATNSVETLSSNQVSAFTVNYTTNSLVSVTVPLNSLNSIYNFYAIKLESSYLGSSTSSTYTGSTGFVIPDYTYPLPFEPDSFPLSVVKPNLLKGADFWSKPYYGTPAFSPYNEVYYTDALSDEFVSSAIPGYDYGYSYLMNQTILTASISAVNPTNRSRFIAYRYYYHDIFGVSTDLRYSLTYALSLGTLSNCTCTISLTDNLSNTFSETFDDFSDVCLLSLYSDSTVPNWDYIDILIEFECTSSDLDTALVVYLNWSKLEPGLSFTGYVPIEHTYPSVCNRNYLNDYNFSDYAPIYSTVSNYWFDSAGSAFLDPQSDGTGLDISGISNDPTFTFSYVCSGLDIVDSTTCIFTLSGRCDGHFLINVSSLANNTYTVIRSQAFLASSYPTLYSVIFPYSDGLKIDLVFNRYAPNLHFYLDYCKLEQGDYFTGFVPSSDDYYRAGVSSVVDYNNGEPVVGAYFDFLSRYYDAINGVNVGDVTSFEPGLLWHDLNVAWIEDDGISITHTNLYVTSFIWNNNPSSDAKYIMAFVFSSAYEMPITITVNSTPFERTVNGDTLIWIAFDYEPTSLSIYVPGQNDTVYWKQFKTEKSPFFTGFPFGTLDYNGGQSSIYYTAYDTGYSNGLSYGRYLGSSSSYNEGYSNGYESGYLVGNSDGVSEGFQNGLQTATTGTWYNMLSALIDVPITFIISFLDFNVLGFNMFNVFKTVVLLSLFFFVLKKLVGKV